MATVAHQQTQTRSFWSFGWLLIIPLMALVSLPYLPSWIEAWVLALALFYMFKVWTILHYLEASLRAPALAMRIAGYVLAWPGMDPAPFFEHRDSVSKPRAGEWAWGIGNTVLGVILFWWIAGRVLLSSPWLAAWIALVALALMLNFGTLYLCALAWRQAGIAVEPVMNAPLRSATVSDFWSNRWNMAFRDLAQTAFFRPLLRRLHPAGAVMIVFAISGLIHDFVISVAARTWYGVPTLYFLGQGFAVLFEKSRVGRRLGIHRGNRGRAFAWLAVVPASYFLFHPPFLATVIVPMMKALGATA